MKTFTISALAQMINAETPANPQAVVTGVSIDSRTIKPGDCFFAIAGEQFDGHDYAAQAFDKAAACVVADRKNFDSSFAGGPILKVPNTVRALGRLAGKYRRQCNYKVVAITGSVGKTTTRQIVHQVLSKRYNVFQSPKNFNNQLGLPLTLLGARAEIDIVIAEIAGSAPGEIGRLSRLAKPDIAVITNVSPAHLAGFGNLQTIVKEKLSITDGLRPGGTLIINADNEQLVNRCRENSIEFTSFGTSADCRIQARDISCGSTDSRFTIEDTRINIPLPGRGNIQNATAAWAICRLFGVSLQEFAEAVKTVTSLPMRTELIKTGTLTILNDCYNANPTSMQNALDILAGLKRAAKARAVFICGDMAELGSKSKYFHKQLGSMIAKAWVKLLIAICKWSKTVSEAAQKESPDTLQTICLSDNVSTCNQLKNLIKDYDVILIKGSRVNKLETVVEKLKELFE